MLNCRENFTSFSDSIDWAITGGKLVRLSCSQEIKSKNWPRFFFSSKCHFQPFLLRRNCSGLKKQKKNWKEIKFGPNNKK